MNEGLENMIQGFVAKLTTLVEIAEKYLKECLEEKRKYKFPKLG